MTTRRGFLAGLLASGLAGQASWADLGAPKFLAAAKKGDAYLICGLSETGETLFSVPMPGRGHGAAAHPEKAEIVALARRPGTFAEVIDVATGQRKAELTSPAGRHFVGHGVFSSDGTLLLTPENDFDAGRGVIGVWDRRQGYKRVGEFASGGVGPHDMLRLPGSDLFVVANGGIETHPDAGRATLNLATMRANLALVDLSGALLEVTELDIDLRLNSIRHMAVRSDGLVGFAMQWQGNPTDNPPLLGLYQPGQGMAPILGQADEELHAAMKGYAGSIAFSGDGAQVAISSPRGGMVQVFDAQTGAFLWHVDEPDVCGLNAVPGGFLATAGTGRITRFADPEVTLLRRDALAWDNHLVTV